MPFVRCIAIPGSSTKSFPRMLCSAPRTEAERSTVSTSSPTSSFTLFATADCGQVVEGTLPSSRWTNARVLPLIAACHSGASSDGRTRQTPVRTNSASASLESGVGAGDSAGSVSVKLP